MEHINYADFESGSGSGSEAHAHSNLSRTTHTHTVASSPPVPTREQMNSAMKIMQNLFAQGKEWNERNHRRTHQRTRRRLDLKPQPSGERSMSNQTLPPMSGTHLRPEWRERTLKSQEVAQARPKWYRAPTPRTF